MYRSAIVDELGTVVWWCDEVINGWDGVDAILEDHPEWSVKAIEIQKGVDNYES